MTTVEELDFRLIFGEDLARQPLDEAVLPGPNAAAGQDGREVRTFDNFYSLISQPISQDLQQGQHATPAPLPKPNIYPHPGYDEVQGSQYASVGNLRSFDCPSIQITNSHPDTVSCQDAKASGGAESQGTEQQTWSRDNLYLSLDPYYRDANLNPSPGSSLSSRSWLSDISSCESFSHVYDDVDGELNEAAARFTLGSPRGTTPSPLPSPGCGGGAFGVEIWQQQYQHTLAFTQALSPHQSPRQSPCPSPRHSPRNSVTDENWLNPRPTSRSNSRPTSPCGKRRHSSADGRARSPSPHHSPSPTPGLSPGHSPRGSVTEDSWIGSPTLGPVLYGCYPELDVPSKTRRTTGTQLAALCGQGEELGASLPFLDSPGGGEECVQQDAGLAELFLPVPSFSWNKPTPGTTPLFRSSSLPPLDWPLPSQYGPCELKIEVQPRAHHRAHYETEGSRGSVKAASGGHPVVKLNGYSAQPVNLQVFIGTADERYLRPHAFYQVHRVTGKTVSTLCLEKSVGITKVLEIPLLPENGMTTSIDCAGILKLRNSDIELRKGETDIGRKNTRARVVFRVYIPQPDGKALCLQAASVPIECSQRSALELPQVDGFSPACCAVDGGPEMVITGSNLSPESRVIFVEKGPDGRTQWEVDVKAIPEKSNGCSIVVEIPPYHNNKTTAAVQVHFYLSNGKRKRSLTQSFTYLAGATAAAFCFVPAGGHGAVGAPLIKQERCDLDYMPAHNPPGVYSTTAAQLPSPDRAFCPDRPFYDYAAPPQPAYSPARSSPLRHPSHLQRGFGPDSAGQPRINAMQTVDLGLASQTMPSSQTVPYSHQSSSPVRSAVVPAARSEHQSGPLRPDQHHHHPAPVRSITSHPTARFNSTGRCESLSASQSTSLHLSAPQTKASSSSQKTQASSPGAPRRALLLSCEDAQKQHVSAPHSLFSSSGDAVSIKQEPDELPHQACMGLQEITLDDVNEIIDRDIFQLSSGDDMVLEAQDPYGWDQNSADTALQFCGSLQ